MFKYQRKIFFSDIDLSGSIYFNHLLKWAQQGFELLIVEKCGSLMQFIDQIDCFLPIVHVEADYCAPLHMGDDVEMVLTLERCGTTSFTLKTVAIRAGIEVGSVLLTHVALNRMTQMPLEIPAQLSRLLQELEVNRDHILR